MSLKGSLAVMSLDNKSYSTFFDNKMREILKSCVQLWLAVAVGKIPVWSGMSQGTLLKLAEKVGYPIAIFPVAEDSKNRGFPGDSIQVGKDASEGELLIQFPKYGMFYQSRVDRLNINEEHDARKWGFHLITPGPYHFINAANKAFEEGAKNRLRGFKTDIKRFIKVTTRSIG